MLGIVHPVDMPDDSDHAPSRRRAALRGRSAGSATATLQSLLNRMLDGFDSLYGTDMPRSIMIATAAHDALATSDLFTLDGVPSRAVTPSGWYRGVPIDVVSHERDWLVAVIATRTSATTMPAIYGDARTGKISSTFPANR